MIDGLDLSRPPYPPKYAGSSDTFQNHTTFSDGLKRASKCRKSVPECRESVTCPIELTSGIGTRECQPFRKKFFDKHTPIAFSAAHKYVQLAKNQSYVEANRFLSELNRHLQIHDLNLTSDEAELKRFARAKSLECLRDSAHLSKENAVQFCKSKLERYGFVVRDDMSATEVLVKLKCEKFWFSKVKRLASQTMEEMRRRLDLVNQSKSPYCSNERLRQHQWEKEQAQEYMQNKWFCSADGEFISMLDAYNANVSNPAIRRAELMVRIKGTEEYSNLLGHQGWFYTLTTPSKYHSHYKSGKPNPKYQKMTVEDARDYLNKQWSKARAQFDREDLKVYGLRVVEPHHDGTPHWHLMLFMPPHQATRVTEIIQHYAMQEDGNEVGATKNRFKAEEIKPEKGSAQDYIAKYICKNIDGEFIDTDRYGNDAKVAASRITAWASLFNIRQFQFIGLPSVTLWRQLRKLNENIKDEELDKLRKAADKSDWLAYLLMMGGSNIKKSQRPFAIEYEKSIKEIYSDFEPSELSKHAFNKKPKTILSVSARLPIPDKGWTLVIEPMERIEHASSACGWRGVDEVSVGHRRLLAVTR